MTNRARLAIPTGLAAAFLLVGCSSDNDDSPQLNTLPGFITGEIQQQDYDGITDDLLTAGLGGSGLASATAPAFADSLNPTPAELRRLAIYTNYRALADMTADGGYGRLYGPQVGRNDDGLVAGSETLALATVPGADHPVTVMVQVPASFDTEQACMVTAPSSGSRGIYGAIGTAGEWGLKQGCAVVYTDKGTGTGSHNLMTNNAQRLDGTISDDDDTPVLFRADLTDAERQAFNTSHPDRLAFKHAHSRDNPEADWGRHVLQSIEFGFYVLNQRYGEPHGDDGRTVVLTPENTLVIASSVSNGGGASVRAAELDDNGWIDGVAVSEPNINPTPDSSFTLRQGDGPVITGHSRSLLDYTSAIALYQGCANRAPAVRDDAPFNVALNNVDVNENTCAALAAKGLVTGATLDEQATDALRILNDEYAIQPEQNLVAPSHYGASVAQAIAMTYANAYGEFPVNQPLCGLSLAATGDQGTVIPLTDAQEAALFATSNGIPPTSGVQLVYDQAAGAPTRLADAVSTSSGLADHGLDALLCLRSLVDGLDPVTGDALSAPLQAQAERVSSGIEAVRASGDLQGKPAVFVTGRADAILPINHTSRPYFGLNRRVEGDTSGLRYYEVLNAHHLDAFNAFPGFDARYVPLHHYYLQALDLVYDRLTTGAELPPSQVVRPQPRGAGAPALTLAQLPAIQPAPAQADRIHFVDNQVRIPD